MVGQVVHGVLKIRLKVAGNRHNRLGETRLSKLPSAIGVFETSARNTRENMLKGTLRGYHGAPLQYCILGNAFKDIFDKVTDRPPWIRDDGQH